MLHVRHTVTAGLQFILQTMLELLTCYLMCIVIHWLTSKIPNTVCDQSIFGEHWPWTYVYTWKINIKQIKRKKMFYLTMLSIYFGHMAKDDSDSERGNMLLPLFFLISSKGYFICTIPQQDSTYQNLCYTSCGALAWTKNSSMGLIW